MNSFIIDFDWQLNGLSKKKIAQKLSCPDVITRKVIKKSVFIQTLRFLGQTVEVY